MTLLADFIGSFVLSRKRREPAEGGVKGWTLLEHF